MKISTKSEYYFAGEEVKGDITILIMNRTIIFKECELIL